ncbi:hypothetical protein SEA_NEDARYA_98 [Gordonia phage Nedarya]|nr:hypothetical protein SEA_NEDARYA_98 [Gordonia phage Nedarya]
MGYIVYVRHGDLLQAESKATKLAAVRQYKKLERAFAATGGWPDEYGWVIESEASDYEKAAVGTVINLKEYQA